MFNLNPPITDWTTQTVWVIGASSGIGWATASALHHRGAKVVVSARDQAALTRFTETHEGAVAMVMDVTQETSVQLAYTQIQRMGGATMVMYCAGYYEPMRARGFDLGLMRRHWQVNYDGALCVLQQVLPDFIGRGHGHLAWVSSVAGYRALPKALGYGPSKAALIHLAESLYQELHPLGIGVSLINPGFVKTPMTEVNDFHMPFLIEPEDAAVAILRGWRRGDFEIAFPKQFTLWLKGLRCLPYGWYFAAIRKLTGV